MGAQLEQFKVTLPHKPYCTDDLEAGLLIRQAKTAITKRYIQHNSPAFVSWLVMDCDYPDALGHIGFNPLPLPNIAAINRANGHSHLFYGLTNPVTRTNQARQKPLRYLASVEFALKTSLGADLGYAGLMSKNPLHAHWLVTELRPTLWDLGELADYLTLPAKLPKAAELVGLGRNCTLFEKARRQAYASVLAYRLAGDVEGFRSHVLALCQALNVFPEPLPSSEIRATAKSIANWTWKRYTGRLSAEAWAEHVKATHTPEIQAERGRKGGLKGGRPKTTTANGKPWEVVGVSRATWYRRQREA